MPYASSSIRTRQPLRATLERGRKKDTSAEVDLPLVDRIPKFSQTSEFSGEFWRGAEGWGMLADRLAMFLLGTVGLAYASRASLRDPRAHGFWRFWAWEAILALFLLNMEGWFRDPFAWHQLVSWVLLAASGFLVIYGTILLKRMGRQHPQREDGALLAFEKTTRLVTVGIYRYIRHPMYSSLLFLAWGVFFKAPSWVGGGLALAATGFLVAAGRMEEAENTRYFGEAYRAYIRRTKMFVPWLF